MAKEATDHSYLDVLFKTGAEIINNSQHKVIRRAFDGGLDLVRGSETDPVEGVGKILQWFSANESLQIIFETLVSNFDGMFEMINTENGGVMHGFPVHTVPLKVEVFKGHRGYEMPTIVRARRIIVHPLGYVRKDKISRSLGAISKNVPHAQGIIRSVANIIEGLRVDPAGDPFGGKEALWDNWAASFIYESVENDAVEIATFAGKRVGNEFQIARMEYGPDDMKNPILNLYPRATSLKISLAGAVGKYCGEGDEAEEIASELTGVGLFEGIKAQLGVQIFSAPIA